MIFREIVRFYLRIDLSEDEIQLLQSSINAFYGSRVLQQGKIVLDKATFVDFLSKSKSRVA